MVFNLNVTILRSAVRNATPPSELAAIPGLGEHEAIDLDAFRKDGWRFTGVTNFDWGSLPPNDPMRPVDLGLLAKREEGGLVIVRLQLVISFGPGADSAPILARYPAERQLSFGRNIHEVTLARPNGNLQQALQDEIDSLQEELGAGSEFVEPVVVFHLAPHLSPPTAIDDEPQWHWERIYLACAWDHVFRATRKGTGKGAGTRVAIIDNGFFEHPEIQNIAARISLTEEGKDRQEPFPHAAHGTMCAGLVGAAADGVLVNGAAPECDLILVAVAETTNSVGFAEALVRCQREGADVISCSLGPYDGSWIKMETLLRAIDAVQTEGRPQMDGSKRGCVVVWAVSNNNKPITSADLESYDPLVCVAPSDKLDGRIASGYGATLDLVAPGKEVAVIDFVAENEWYIVGRAGSSLAAPIGAGVAALVLSKNPNLFWYEVIRILTVDSCDPEQPHNHTIDLGFGRLNALRAVKATPLR